MKIRAVRNVVGALALAVGLVACGESTDTMIAGPEAPALAVLPGGAQNGGGFQHGPTLNVDGTDYYLAGAPDGPDGAFDIPGHYWVVGGNGQLVGKHYNTGPFGAPQWWSSDAPDGALLYVVHGIVDGWSEQTAAEYAGRGYIHYHELITVAGGTLHPDKVVWLRHIARTRFTLDGGPRPDLSHSVSPGVDLEFIPNGMTPYTP